MRARTLLLALSLALPVPASGTVLFDWGIDELARRADLVVLATVEARSSVEVDHTLMTDTTLTVERAIVGAAGPTLTLRQLGGRRGPRIVDVPGDAALELGRRYLLFLRCPREGARCYLVGMSLGALALDARGVLTQRIDVPLMSSGGALVPAPAPRRYALDRLERLVREARR